MNSVVSHLMCLEKKLLFYTFSHFEWKELSSAVRVNHRFYKIGTQMVKSRQTQLIYP